MKYCTWAVSNKISNVCEFYQTDSKVLVTENVTYMSYYGVLGFVLVVKCKHVY